MKTFISLIAVAFLGGMASAVAQEDPPDLKKSAYQTGASQDQLRGETRRVKEAIAALREEFSGYRSMQGELSMLESAMRDLAALEDYQIPETGTIFKDASRLDDAKEIRLRLIDGSLEQKKTQIILREMADRLFLQRDLAVMRNRYYDLALRQATNLRQIRPNSGPAADDPAVTSGPEQLAIAREITAANAALKALATGSPPLRAKFFVEALAKAENGKLEQTAEDAALTTGAKLQRAVSDKAASQATLATLKSVIAALDAGRTPEDRTNELVRRLDTLLNYQNSLTKFTPKVTTGTRAGVVRGQGYLSDSMDLAQDGIAQLHEEAARYNASARGKSEDLVTRFEQPISNQDPEAVKAAVDDQNSVAADIKAARDLLQKKAEELAEENSSPELEEFLNSLEQAEASDLAEMMEMPQEMRDLIKMLLDAKAKIQKAKAMLKEQQDPKEPREQVHQSGKDLTEANDTAGQLEGMIPQEVIEHIRKAGQRNGDAANKLGPNGQQPGQGPQPGPGQQPGAGEGQQPGEGSGEGQQPGQGEGQASGQGQQPGAGEGQGQGAGQGAGGDLDQAEAEIDKALEALKSMMMGMGAGQGEGEGEGQGQGEGQGKGQGQGQGLGKGPGAGQGGEGGEGRRYGKARARRGVNSPSGIKPVEANERDREREALMLLEKEKPPTDYEQMVDQYIRNLGKGELPAR
jgi:hypothetical protein